jgi:hypothetical protein
MVHAGIGCFSGSHSNDSGSDSHPLRLEADCASRYAILIFPPENRSNFRYAACADFYLATLRFCTWQTAQLELQGLT